MRDLVSSKARRRSNRVLLAVAGLVVVASLSGCLNAGQDSTMAAMNADRVAHGRRALPVDAVATKKAQAWALHLSKLGRLSHSRLADGFEGVHWCALGENVGYGGTPEIIERAYMRSPSHRDNILSTWWTAAGVGYRRVGGRIYTVQVFVKMC